MPYINQSDRPVVFAHPETPGELNYCLTMVALEYLKAKGQSYTTINTIMGAFDCAAKEFYRRVAVPYEQKKIAENGDVYLDVPIRTVN